MAVMNKLQASYLAGLIDGEGYIGILKVKKGNKKKFSSTRDYRYDPVFKISMCSKELLEDFHKSFGGQFSMRSRRNINPNWKDAYDWTVKSKKCMDILKLVYPYLRIKKIEVDILNRFYKTNNGAGHPISDENWAIRDEMYAQIRELHYRGSGTVRD